MVKTTIAEDAPVLIQNPEHKNFTETNQIIPKGTEIEGEVMLIKGKRRGEDFTYRIFKTNQNQIIYLNKTTMKTEVTLGATDAKSTAPEVDVKVSQTPFYLKKPVIFGVAGLASGMAFAKYKKYDTKKTAIVSAVLALAGYAVGKYIDKKNGIVVAQKK